MQPRILLSLIVLIIVLTGCQRGGSGDLPDIGLELSVAPTPLAVGPVTLTLILTGADGRPVSGATLELEGNMSHAGMTPVFSQATEIAPGQYEAPLELTMVGDWFVLVRGTLPDGRTFERQVDLPGVQPG